MDPTDQEQEARRALLREWVTANGGHAAVVRDRHLSGSQASFLSQVTNGYSFGPRAARAMEARLGMRPRFLEGDSGVTRTQGKAVSIAHSMSHTPVTMSENRLTWEQIVAGADLGKQFETQMMDDSCGELCPRGHWIVWRTDKAPQFGKLILARDAHNQLHARVYTQGKRPGEWSAEAVNKAYASFTASELTLIAVSRGILDPD